MSQCSARWRGVTIHRTPMSIRRSILRPKAQPDGCQFTAYVEEIRGSLAAARVAASISSYFPSGARSLRSLCAARPLRPSERGQFEARRPIRRYPSQYRQDQRLSRARLSSPGASAADFAIQGPGQHGVAGLINVYRIESPGLTAALASGEVVAARRSGTPRAPGVHDPSALHTALTVNPKPLECLARGDTAAPR